jgi:hypothetical protein
VAFETANLDRRSATYEGTTLLRTKREFDCMTYDLGDTDVG